MTDEYDDEVRRFELALDLAVDAARVGAGIIPLVFDDGRWVPKVSYKDATHDVETIASFMRSEGDGIAVVGGGSLIALDMEHPSKPDSFGAPKGIDGRASIADVSSVLGGLPRTRATNTKNGGLHLLFRLPRGAVVRQAHEVLNGLEVALPGVDVVPGAIRLPLTPGYTVACDAPIAELPARWLRAVSDPPPQKAARRRRFDPAQRTQANLSREVERVGGLLEGRSAALNAIAYAFALDVDEVTLTRELMTAAESNGTIRKRGRRAALGIIRGGIRARQRKGGVA